MPWFRVHYIEQFEYEETIQADNPGHAIEQFKDALMGELVDPIEAKVIKLSSNPVVIDNGGHHDAYIR